MVTSKETVGGQQQAGSLEQEALSALWSADGAQTPAEVEQAMDAGLAYTTVMTTLTRLHGKGLVQRVRSGRAYAYSRWWCRRPRGPDDGGSPRSGGRPGGGSHPVRRAPEPDEEAVLRRLLERAETAERARRRLPGAGDVFAASLLLPATRVDSLRDLRPGRWRSAA